MTKKITISIPDELHDQLKNFRDSINISKTSAEALLMKVNDIDSTLQEAQKRFNILALSEYIGMAYENGIKWAGYQASAVELAIVCNWTYDWVANDKVCQETIDLLEANNEEIERILSGYTTGYEYILANSFIDRGIVPNPDPTNDDHIQIAVGFAQGAQIIWNKISSKLIPKLINP
jgi:hypothetical protein